MPETIIQIENRINICFINTKKDTQKDQSAFLRDDKSDHNFLQGRKLEQFS